MVVFQVAEVLTLQNLELYKWNYVKAEILN